MSQSDVPEPKTVEGKRLYEWWWNDVDHDDPGTPRWVNFDKGAVPFDEIAEVVLDQADRVRLPDDQEELVLRMAESLRAEIGGMFRADDEAWMKAARATITRIGITFVYSEEAPTFVLEDR